MSIADLAPSAAELAAWQEFCSTDPDASDIAAATAPDGRFAWADVHFTVIDLDDTVVARFSSEAEAQDFAREHSDISVVATEDGPMPMPRRPGA